MSGESEDANPVRQRVNGEDAVPEETLDGAFEQHPWIITPSGLKLERVSSPHQAAGSILEEHWAHWRGTMNVFTTSDNHGLAFPPATDESQVDAASSSGIHDAHVAQESTGSCIDATVQTGPGDAQSHSFFAEPPV